MTISLWTFMISATLIVFGLIILIIGVIGVFRIKYVLNRLHSAAMIDSLGLLLITAGVMVLRGFSFDSAKLLMMVAIFWIASPLCSHLLASLEVSTNRDYRKDAEVANLEDIMDKEKE